MIRRIILTIGVALCISAVSGQTNWGLRECMEYAVKNSPKGKIQDANNENAKKDYQDAVLKLLPSVSGSVGASTSFGRSIDFETNTYTNTANFNNSYGISGNLPVFNGFSAVNNVKVSKIARLQGVEKSQQIEDEIALQTMQAYFNVLYYNGMLNLAREQLNESKENLRNTQVLEELGLKGNADVLQIEAKVAENDFNLTRQTNQYKDALLILKESMFYPIEKELTVDTAVYWQVMPLAEKELPDSIFQTALGFLPDVRLSGYDLRTAQLDYRTSKWQLLPSISVGGGYNTGYSKYLSGSDIVADPFREQLRNRAGQSVSISMNIPIFNGLNRQHQVTKKKNQAKIAQYQYDQKLHEVETEIERAVQEMDGAAKEYVQASKQVIAQEIAHEANQKKYKEGLMSILELQTSENQLLSAKAQKLNTQLQYLIKRRVVDYYKGTPYMEQSF